MGDTDWAWGKGLFDGKIIIFENKFLAGGYKCMLCDMKLDKRFDNIMKHLKSGHEDLGEAECKVLAKGIPRIKIKCKYCNVGFDLTGVKEARHFAVCKARMMDSSAGKKSDTSRSQRNKVQSMFGNNTLVVEVPDNGSQVMANIEKVQSVASNRSQVEKSVKPVTKRSQLEVKKNKMQSVELVPKERSLVKTNMDKVQPVEVKGTMDMQSGKVAIHRDRKMRADKMFGNNTLGVEMVPDNSSQVMTNMDEVQSLASNKAQSVVPDNISQMKTNMDNV